MLQDMTRRLIHLSGDRKVPIKDNKGREGNPWFQQDKRAEHR